ncbi:unnamed protein product [Aphanomyces euteiches]
MIWADGAFFIMGNIFQRHMKQEQWIMGSVFTAMGLGTMFFPDLVHEYCFDREFSGELTPALKLVLQCFGSQAALCGWTILSTKWDASSYRNFGLAMIPYFVFDAYAAMGAITPLGALGDGLGNVIFATCCYFGYRSRKDEEEKSPPLL